MKTQRGIAIGLVLVMLLLMGIAASGILLFVRGSTEMVYKEVRKDKAYYAAEAGLQLGLYKAQQGQPPGTYGWKEATGKDFAIGGEPVEIRYTISQDGENTTVSAVVDTEKIKVQ